MVAGDSLLLLGLTQLKMPLRNVWISCGTSKCRCENRRLNPGRMLELNALPSTLHWRSWPVVGSAQAVASFLKLSQAKSTASFPSLPRTMVDDCGSTGGSKDDVFKLDAY